MSCYRCEDAGGCCVYCCDCFARGHFDGYRAGILDAARIVGEYIPAEPTHRTDVANALAEYKRKILGFLAPAGGSDASEHSAAD